MRRTCPFSGGSTCADGVRGHSLRIPDVHSNWHGARRSGRAGQWESVAAEKRGETFGPRGRISVEQRGGRVSVSLDLLKKAQIRSRRSLAETFTYPLIF